MSIHETRVDLSLGALIGKTDIARDGKEFLVFHNIPYAQPPIGELRFKAPKPIQPWTGVLDARHEGPECYSMHQFTQKPVGSEDCLKLNVYTPTTQRSAKLPVMVWIHGGGFTSGSSKLEFYGPQFLLTQNVLLVTINYRVGALGFLSLADQSLGVPGNAGLKDQVMALKWIREHIACFGGDAGNVTVFGESAGAAAVHYLLLSPMAQGLFHKVIMQSGSALNPWARGHRAGMCSEFLEALNISEGTDEKDVLKKLQAVPKEAVLEAQLKCRDLFRPSDIRPFSPVVEGPNKYEESFLLEEPIQLLRDGNFNKMPILMGYTKDEGMLFDYIESRRGLDLKIVDYRHLVPFYYENDLQVIANKIKQFYFERDDCASERQNLRVLYTDVHFLRGIYLGLELMRKVNANPIYFYRFSVDAGLNLFKKFGEITDAGTCHCDDVFYIFNSSLTPEVIEPKSSEGITINRMITFWANFAKTCDPNRSTKDSKMAFEVEWPATDGTRLLNIDNELNVMNFPEFGRMQFWDELDSIAKY